MIEEAFDLNEVVFAAFRYYMGRRTISTHSFIDGLEKCFPNIEEGYQTLILKELKEAVEWEAQDKLDKWPMHDPLGDDIDRKRWTLFYNSAMVHRAMK